ncbi:hypothetical protein [Streptomyces scabiei]|nr:hypothetical protein [Streptomyces scabiei]
MSTSPLPRCSCREASNLLLTQQSFEDYEDAMRYIFTARVAELQN